MVNVECRDTTPFLTFYADDECSFRVTPPLEVPTCREVPAGGAMGGCCSTDGTCRELNNIIRTNAPNVGMTVKASAVASFAVMLLAFVLF